LDCFVGLTHHGAHVDNGASALDQVRQGRLHTCAYMQSFASHLANSGICSPEYMSFLDSWQCAYSASLGLPQRIPACSSMRCGSVMLAPM